ncbi:MAG: copper resistance protein B [Halieaceae bacterium]
MSTCLKRAFWLLFLSSASTAMAMGDDDPMLAMVRIDRLEVGVGETHTPQRLEADAWLGHDLHKLWLKAELEREGGETESAEMQLQITRAIAPYWDLKLGWKRDFQPTPQKDWLAFGAQGLAPYFFETHAEFFLGASGRASFEFDAEYELLFTQRWILSPEVELSLNGYNDESTGQGSGLSSAELGLRLRYEIRREFAPYIGVHWEKSFGNTASYKRREGADTSDTQLVVGLRAWF